MANKSIQIPVLNDEYKTIVCWGDDKFVAKVGRDWGHKNTIKLDRSKHRGCTWYQEDAHPIIVLQGKPKTPQEIGTLAHEALHAVLNVLDKIDETSRSEEVVAHSLGALVRRVLEAK